jgi:hypothetical protein
VIYAYIRSFFSSLLGANSDISEVSIRWPNGEAEVLRDLPADFIYTVVEGAGIQQKVALPPLPQR